MKRIVRALFVVLVVIVTLEGVFVSTNLPRNHEPLRVLSGDESAGLLVLTLELGKYVLFDYLHGKSKVI